MKGILPDYKLWYLHGERPNMYPVSGEGDEQHGDEVHDPIVDAVRDAFCVHDEDHNDESEGNIPGFNNMNEAYEFNILMEQADKPLY